MFYIKFNVKFFEFLRFKIRIHCIFKKGIAFSMKYLNFQFKIDDFFRKLLNYDPEKVNFQQKVKFVTKKEIFSMKQLNVD